MKQIQDGCLENIKARIAVLKVQFMQKQPPPTAEFLKSLQVNLGLDKV